MRPGTELAVVVLLLLLWLIAGLRLDAFFGVWAIGWAVNVWARWRRDKRRSDRDQMPDWMRR